MSLVTGLLNKTCDVMKPVFADDGAGGQMVTGYTLVDSSVCVLVSQTNQSFLTADGGRLSKTDLVAYFEWNDENHLNSNWAITNVTDANGNVETDIVNGVSAPRWYKLLNPNDPNGEEDHMEFRVESFHGRQAQP